MAMKQTVQELKSERVQEEIALVREEPFRISLKSERVQQPGAVAARPDAQGAAPAFELILQLSPPQEVMIAVTAQGTIITI